MSDLHLRDGDGPQAQRFCRFLDQVPQKNDTLVLGGDIFDLFVGNKEVFRQKFAPVLGSILSAAQRGIIIFYLEGNHDFHFRSLFDGAKIQVRSEDFGIEVDQKKIWISHGDLIDPEDRGYRFLRWFLRTPVLRALIWLLPGGCIHVIGNRSSETSRKYNEGRIDENTKQRLRNLYTNFAKQQISSGWKFVFVGHSHIFDHVNLGSGFYVNLGFDSDSVVFGSIAEGSQVVEIHRFS